MIGTFAAGTTDPLVAKNQMIFFHILKMLIMILRYLEAKFVNDYFIFLFSLESHNSKQVISSHFDQY